MLEITKYNFAKHEKAFVAFIDILGFSSKVREANNEQEIDFLKRLLIVCKETSDRYSKEKGFFRDVYILTVSDSLMVIVPYDAKTHHENSQFNGIYIGATAIISILRQIQYELLACFKTLIRGYVAQGDIYMDKKNNIFFGAGYIDAVEGEKSIGNAPRIVISPLIVEESIIKIKNSIAKAEKMSYILESLLEDNSDEHYFIDYLSYGDSIAEMNKQIDFNKENEDIGNFIRANLDKYARKKCKIYQKYKWLESYFYRDKKLFSEYKF